MPQLLQPSLTGGELSPSHYARVDLARFGTSLRTCRNFIVSPYGGIVNRPGTKLVREVKFSDRKTILIPFEFSATETYVIEIGHLYARFHTNGATVVSSGVPVEIVTPWAETDLVNLHYTQSADVVTVAYKTGQPQEIRRTSASSFSLTAFANVNGPFRDINTATGTKVYASAATGSVTLTANSNIFTAAHVGSLFYIEEEQLQVIPPWEASKVLAAVGANPLGLLRRSDGKVYQCVTDYVASGQPVITGTVRPVHDIGTAMDGDGNAITSTASKAGVSWQYLHSGYGIAKITGYTDGQNVTATVINRLPDSVVGGTTVSSTWSGTGNGVTTTLSVTGATSSDPTAYEVLVSGVPLSPTLYSVNSTTDILTFLTAPANLAPISVKQLSTNNTSSSWAFGAWSDAYGYPVEVEYYGGRLVFAGSTGAPQTIWFSKVGNFTDFGQSTPLVDDDAVAETLAAKRQQAIVELIPIDSLVIMTNGGEWRTTADANNALTPSSIGFRPQSYNGSASLPALVYGNSAVYLQRQGGIVRGIGYDVETDSYAGDDLTLFANHLFAQHTIVSWCYQSVPFKAVWAVRDDGKLLTLTYDKSQQILGWAQHDTDGYFECVACVPEGNEDFVYAVVRRTINGVTRRFVERFASRNFANIREAIFLDCALTFDGRNTGVTTLTLSGGTQWVADEPMTLTASAALFAAGDVGDQVALTGSTDPLRLKIIGYTSPTAVTVLPQRDVGVELRSATTAWEFLRDTFSGLSHLANRAVSALADGYEVAGLLVNSAGTVTLPAPAAVVHIGLPYVSDIETLDVNIIGAETIRMKSKRVTRVGVYVQESRGFWAGVDADNLNEFPARAETDSYGLPAQVTDLEPVWINGTWQDTGRVLIRQPSPLPLTILGIIPDVAVGK